MVLADGSDLDDSTYQGLKEAGEGLAQFRVEPGQPGQPGQQGCSGLTNQGNSELVEQAVQTDPEQSEFEVVGRSELTSTQILRQAIECVTESLKYQVDLKWVNLTINDVRCKKCRKYPVVGRVLRGPGRDTLCEQCYSAINSTFSMPSLGQGLINMLFKKKVEHEAEKRAYIAVLKELAGPCQSLDHYEWLMQQHPRKSVD